MFKPGSLVGHISKTNSYLQGINYWPSIFISAEYLVAAIKQANSIPIYRQVLFYCVKRK